MNSEPSGKTSTYITKRDGLVDLIKAEINNQGSIEAGFAFVDDLFAEHFSKCEEVGQSDDELIEIDSRLASMLPSIGRFFLPLNLREALSEYDKKYNITKRKYIRASFREIRHVLNTAQIHSSAPLLRLLTLDADGTLYEDGGYISSDNPHSYLILELLQKGVYVAIVTAAGYPHDAARYEARFAHLLVELQNQPKEIRERFYVIGGEANYCFQPTADGRLRELDDADWKTDQMLSWKETDIQRLLSDGKQKMRDTLETLGISHQFKFIDKERAVGLVPVEGVRPRTEAVCEIALTVQNEVQSPNIPFCCFADHYQVWMDIGNKSLGVQALQSKLGIAPIQTLHIGDQLLRIGNDIAARMCSSTIWVQAPKETRFFVSMILNDIEGASDSQTQPVEEDHQTVQSGRKNIV